MPIITDMKPQKDKNRINLYLDGSYFCGLQVETAMKNKLKIGEEIEKDNLENLQLESEGRRAFEYALKLLDRKQYSEQEMKGKLRSKGYLEKTIYHTTLKLKEYKYIDDSTFAKNMVRSLSTKSRREVAQKLSQKGISKTLIEQQLEEIDDFQELENCTELARKHSKNKEKTLENKSKTFRYLVGKGFGFEVAKTAINIIYNDTEDVEL